MLCQEIKNFGKQNINYTHIKANYQGDNNHDQS